MALTPTNPKKTPITEGEFRQKLKNKDGDFQNRIFNFAITRDSLQKAVGLAEDGNIHFNFDLDFGYSEFQTIDVGSDMPYNYDAPKVRFSGKVNFEGARFSGEVNFNNVTFSEEANFYSAKFSDIANFLKATFKGEAKFDRATFSDIAIFWQATFSEANFFKATFSGEADFSKATFKGEANFSEARFSRAVYFDSATFSGKADFSKATFSEANFIGATFKGGVDFIGATFSEANFWETTFKGEAKFFKATFSGKAKFIGVTFLEKAFFYAATFSKEAHFFETTFSRKVHFTEAIFSGEVSFDGATFSGKVSFDGATFSEKAKFIGATFSEEADFTNTIFKNEVHFRRASFSQSHYTYFCNLNLKQKDNADKRNKKETHPAPRLQFRDIIFPQLILFSNCNLSQTTFERCTIADIKFRSCEFAKTGFFIFKRNAFENRTRQKSFWKNFCLALRLEGRLLKKAFSKNQDSRLTKKRDEIEREIKEIEKEIKELEKNNEKLQQKTQDKSQKLETNPFKLAKIIQFPKQIFQKKTKNKTQSTKIINFQKKKQATKELKKISLKLAKLNKKLHSIELETEEKRKDREDLCCQMKTALESSKRWRQAGDFYIGELEARRSKNWWEYLKLTCFKYLLGYAERISILFISITILFFAAALILGDSLYGFSFDGWFVNYNWSCFEFDFEKAAKSTLFPLTLRIELKADDAIKFWETAFLIASWVLWITLAVAVRRRFRF